MLPAEGDVNAHSLFREIEYFVGTGAHEIRQMEQSLSYLEKAESWPENLFSGEPYLADNRITTFMAAYCYEKSKDPQGADPFLQLYSGI